MKELTRGCAKGLWFLIWTAYNKWGIRTSLLFGGLNHFPGGTLINFSALEITWPKRGEGGGGGCWSSLRLVTANVRLFNGEYNWNAYKAYLIDVEWEIQDFVRKPDFSSFLCGPGTFLRPCKRNRGLRDKTPGIWLKSFKTPDHP